MQVTIRGKKYNVRWIHFNPLSKFRVGVDECIQYVPSSGLSPITGKTFTECIIQVGKTTLGNGLAMLHDLDKKKKLYNPEKGRKIALMKALQACEISKRNRAAFWKVYLGGA